MGVFGAKLTQEGYNEVSDKIGRLKMAAPGRYTGLADDEDEFDFKERFTKLKADFEAQLQEKTRLNALIAENLVKVKI